MDPAEPWPDQFEFSLELRSDPLVPWPDQFEFSEELRTEKSAAKPKQGVKKTALCK